MIGGTLFVPRSEGSKSGAESEDLRDVPRLLTAPEQTDIRQRTVSCFSFRFLALHPPSERDRHYRAHPAHTVTHIPKYRSPFQRIFPRSYVVGKAERRFVQRVRHAAAGMRELSDAGIAEYVRQQRQKIRSGTSHLDQAVVITVFACVGESVRRTLAIDYYDVQLIAGIVLASGSIAEMKTGEGKTIVTALPAVLFSLLDRGVHVATVNSYLAGRDFALLKPVYERLGLTTGLLADGDAPKRKKLAYDCDITYGTGYEFGFDYLRDQLALQQESGMPAGDLLRRRLRGQPTLSSATVQGKLAFAIIDEVDSVLIDEADTPLVISGPHNGGRADPSLFQRARDVAVELREDEHFVWTRRNQSIELTDAGIEKAFEQQPPSIQRPWSMYIEQALCARLVKLRNVDYIVVNDEVKIVDGYTGRILSERTWRDGLHQAVEAKEGVTVTQENRSLAQISRQQFYQRYEQICGMSGTVCGHERELEHFYRKSVVRIPLRKPCIRKRVRPRFFATTRQKIEAVGESIREFHAQGRPVLVGTRTIAASKELSKALSKLQLPHQLLNGVQHEEEAHIIEQAGQAGAITIATNMAGRGTDIKLSKKSREAGGLHVLSLEFHDSRRIDQQLEGRAGRQGDPGSSQFFASAEDDLFQKHATSLAESIIVDANEVGETKRDFGSGVRKVQAIAEQLHYQHRRKVFEQQQWLNRVLTTIAEPTREPSAGERTGAAA